MKSMTLCLIVVMVGCVATTDAQDPIQTVDDLIEAHLSAIGGLERWQAIHTLTYVGTYEEKGSKQRHRFDRKRPGWIRVTTNYNDETGEFGYAEGFNGAAWEYSSQVPVWVTGMPARALRNAAAFDPPFLDPDARGDRLELIGITQLRDRDVYQMRTHHPDGNQTDTYFDASSFVRVMSLSRAPMHGEGKTLEILAVSSDFRRVGGVLLPHVHQEQELVSGKVLATVRWDRIEANTPLEDEWFAPPPAPEALLFADLRTAAIDGRLEELPKLYASYREVFDRQRSQQLENELNTLGYELLSHERFTDAIAVFRMALERSPESANLHDSLGEAQMLGGMSREAIASYRRSYELDADNAHALKMIEKIEQELGGRPQR